MHILKERRTTTTMVVVLMFLGSFGGFGYAQQLPIIAQNNLTVNAPIDPSLANTTKNITIFKLSEVERNEGYKIDEIKFFTGNGQIVKIPNHFGLIYIINGHERTHFQICLSNGIYRKEYWIWLYIYYITPPPTGADVHFQTLDGILYTFNGAGDYLFLDSTNLTIHTRIIKTTPQSSVFAALAIKDKISGQILEVWWDGKDASNVIFNIRNKGEKLNNVASRSQLMTTEVSSILENLRLGVGVESNLINIFSKNCDEFVLTIIYGGRSTFKINVPKNWHTSGLVGNNNNIMEDDLCYEKSCIPIQTATNYQIHEYALKWKVLPQDVIFENVMKVHEHELVYNPLVYNEKDRLDANKLCGQHQPCLFDYLSTKDVIFANHTLNDFSKTFYFAGTKI